MLPNLDIIKSYILQNSYNPTASEASREVANLTERKNPHTPYMVSKNLSICLSVTILLASNVTSNECIAGNG